MEIEDKNRRVHMENFLNIMDKLLSDEGCPWDRVQTHESLRRYLIEESYEVIDAINKKNSEGLCEELGDVLLQVVFHAKLAEKEGLFTFDDVVKTVSDKMINRHPHVFGSASAETPSEVLETWEEIKKKEKHYESGADVLESIPDCLPALMRAEKLINKAAKFGGEAPSAERASRAAAGKIAELENAAISKNVDINDISELIGEILFEIVKISCFFKINPEFVLTNQSEKFITIFRRFGNADRT